MGKIYPPYQSAYKDREVQALEEGQLLQYPFQEETTLPQENRQTSLELFKDSGTFITSGQGMGYPLKPL